METGGWVYVKGFKGLPLPYNIFTQCLKASQTGSSSYFDCHTCTNTIFPFDFHRSCSSTKHCLDYCICNAFIVSTLEIPLRLEMKMEVYPSKHVKVKKRTSTNKCVCDQIKLQISRLLQLVSLYISAWERSNNSHMSVSQYSVLTSCYFLEILITKREKILNKLKEYNDLMVGRTN